MGTSLSFARVFDACNHAKSTRNPVLFASSKSIRKSAKVQLDETVRQPDADQPYKTTRAPDRSGILNVGGFSDAVFSVVAAFLADDNGRFVAEVEAVDL
jgi:hypothetical protein